MFTIFEILDQRGVYRLVRYLKHQLKKNGRNLGGEFDLAGTADDGGYNEADHAD